MSFDTDLITAQEFDWIVNNEPTFQVQGRKFIGKVGKTPSGEDIRIAVTLPPEFYPVVKPNVEVINEITHPNIDPDGSLALQILDEWEPHYRIKDVISAVRRLFNRSRNAIKPISKEVSSVMRTQSYAEIEELTKEIATLQEDVRKYSQQINRVKSQNLSKVGVNVIPSQAIPISPQKDNQATLRAIQDFLDLIQIKFEEADMDEIAFFRLYRKYTKEHYLIRKNTVTLGGTKNDLSEKKTERPIGS